jgi:hypothetical protein
MNNRSRVIIMTVVLLIGIVSWLPLRPRRVAAQSVGLTGSYGFTLTAQYSGGDTGSGAIMGVITFDGAGNVAIRSTTVGVDSDPNATTVQGKTGQLTGTYTVSADGTGTVTLASGGTVAFVITDGGSGVMLLPTAGFGNTLVTGTARKQ